MSIQSRLLRIFSVIFMLTMIFSGLPLSSASAQAGDGIERHFNAQTGKVNFIGPASGRALPASQALATSIRPQDPALALMKRFGAEFGLKNPAGDLEELKTERSANGRVTARYQQNYKGIPVMGGELLVNTNENGDLYSINGEVSPDLSLQTQPTVAPARARQIALQAAAKWYQKQPEDFQVSAPQLWIFDEGLLRPSLRAAELVWRMEVTPVNHRMPVRELVLVNAERGSLSLHFNQVDTAWGASAKENGLSISNLAGNPAIEADVSAAPLLQAGLAVSTYTAGNTALLPGTFLCDQASPNCTSGGNLHADSAHKYAIGTYNFYLSQHGRNGIDGNNMPIISTVDYCEDPLFACPYANAFWSGAQLAYGNAYGFPLADDVVAHELTHAVTQYESNLFYYYQSGAINESFSDIWGEFYDQTNGQGTDTSTVKWRLGEDVSGLGAIRSMNNPILYGQPDRILSSNYYEGEDDNGGVHKNSGVNNKAAYLMVNGGSFNSKTVTALGWDKTAAIYYEVNSNLLTSGADYSDLYFALQQACSNLVGQIGITAANCVEVKDAIDAVQMNAQPATNFNTDAPYCSAGVAPAPIFSDDLESGTGNWTFTNGAHLRWQFDSPYGPYAHSGLHSLYADDYDYQDAIVTDATAQLVAVAIPADAYLHFAHAYGFETGYNPGDPTLHNFDGGVLEYSLDGGATWTDAGSLMEYNGYKGTIFTGAGNPLSDRAAFVGSSHGYISTRLNLASLAGQTAIFRWRMGLDEAVALWGWWVDDVKIYQCPGADMTPPTVSSILRTGPEMTSAAYVSFTVTFSEPVTGVDMTGPTFSDFSLTQTGVTGATISNVSGAGSSYTATVNTGTGSGTIRLNVSTAATINDLAGNPLGSLPFTTGQTYTMDRSLPSNWYIGGIGTVPFGAGTDSPVVADYNGDNVDEIAVFRPSNSTWYINGLGASFVWGTTGDIPVPADYNGDGQDEVAVFRPSNSTWYIVGRGAAFVWGTVGDIPVPADYNGDGMDEVAVFRPSNSTWYIAGLPYSFVWGKVGDIPVVADYDGNGMDDVAVFRPSNSTWYIVGRGAAFVWGTVGDIPVVADYDGNGTDDVAVFRPSNGTWYIAGVGNILWGQYGDIPVNADFNGDGRADVAVFRP